MTCETCDDYGVLDGLEPCPDCNPYIRATVGIDYLPEQREDHTMADRRPNGSDPITGRSIRVPDPRWERFRATALKRGETMSAVLNAFIEAYGRGHVTKDGRLTAKGIRALGEED